MRKGSWWFASLSPSRSRDPPRLGLMIDSDDDDEEEEEEDNSSSLEQSIFSAGGRKRSATTSSGRTAHDTLRSVNSHNNSAMRPSSPAWDHVNWSTTYSSDEESAIRRHCSEPSLDSLAAASEEGEVHDDSSRRSSQEHHPYHHLRQQESLHRPLWLSPGTRRRTRSNSLASTAVELRGFVVDTSAAASTSLSSSDYMNNDDDRRRRLRGFRWTPFRILALLFLVASYTIFGLSSPPGVEVDAALSFGNDPKLGLLGEPKETAADSVKADMGPMTHTESTSLRASPHQVTGPVHQQKQQASPPLQLKSKPTGKFLYAVRLSEANSLTFKKAARAEEVRRFYQQPAFHNSPVISASYYAAVLAAVLLWAVREQRRRGQTVCDM